MVGEKEPKWIIFGKGSKAQRMHASMAFSLKKTFTRRTNQSSWLHDYNVPQDHEDPISLMLSMILKHRHHNFMSINFC